MYICKNIYSHEIDAKRDSEAGAWQDHEEFQNSSVVHGRVFGRGAFQAVSIIHLMSSSEASRYVVTHCYILRKSYTELQKRGSCSFGPRPGNWASYLLGV